MEEKTAEELRAAIEELTKKVESLANLGFTIRALSASVDRLNETLKQRRGNDPQS